MGEGSDEVTMDGTSMATAHVTGAVALFLQDNPQASASQVVAALDASGDAVILGVPAGTTNKTVRVSELMQMQVPPFFHYAVTAGNNLVLDEAITFSVEDGALVNTNIFANNDIIVKTSQVLVKGFAYHGNNFKDNYGSFQPIYNPTNLPVHHQVAEIVVPQFDPQDHPGVATQVSSDDLQLAGHYDLGTREQPVIWHVQGDLTTGGDVSFSGYGVFMVDNNIEIKHNMTLAASEGALGLYANNNVEVKESNLTIMGMLLSGNNMAVSGNTTLYGTVVVENNLSFKGQTTIYYRSVFPALTEPFWPMNGQ